MSRTAGRDDKIASGIVVYLMEELGDARLRAAQLKQYIAKALELVEKSEKRDHFFEVAADLIHGIPDVLFKLDKSLDAAAMAAARMDYEEIKQGLKPEKAEELERVLEDVRLHYLKRRSSVMNAKEAAHTLELFAKVTEAKGSVPSADLVRFVARLEGGAKTASAPKDPAKFFREAAEYLRTAEHPSRNELVASLRRVLADALVAEEVEAGAGEEFKKVNPDISDEAVEKIDEMHEKNKDVVKDKSAAADPSALANFEVAANKARVAYKAATTGKEAIAVHLGVGAISALASALAALAPKHGDALMALGEKAERLGPMLKSEAAREDLLPKMAAYGDPYWMTAKYPGKDQDGKPFKKGDKVFYYPRTKTILTGPDAEKAAREFGAMAADEDFYNYRAATEQTVQGLDDACWEGYEAYGLKPGADGGEVPNCVPVKTAASWKEVEDSKGHRWMMNGQGDTIDAAHVHEIQGPGTPLYVLKFILKDGTALKDRTNYKKLADAQKAALKWLKSDEGGASLVFQNFSKLATNPVALEAWKAAGAGEEFKKVNPKITDEQVEEINRMHEENKDNLKTASNPKTEAAEVMQKVMAAIEKHLGKDDLKEMFENPEAVKERGFPRLKLVQNKLVHVTFAIAEASKWDSPQRQHQVTQLGLSDVKMSPEAGEWYTDQTDAVQNTMARQILLNEAKKLGIKLDRAHTIHAASTDSWKA